MDILLSRGEDPHRPSLENRVPYQWEAQADLLGYRHTTKAGQHYIKKLACRGCQQIQATGHYSGCWLCVWQFIAYTQCVFRQAEGCPLKQGKSSLFKSLNLKIEDKMMMPVMNGSQWFDKHKFLLSFLLFLEAIHDILQIPGCAHSVCFKLITSTRDV